MLCMCIQYCVYTRNWIISTGGCESDKIILGTYMCVPIISDDKRQSKRGKSNNCCTHAEGKGRECCQEVRCVMCGMKSFWMLNLDDVHPCLMDAKICSIPTVDAKDDFLTSEICWGKQFFSQPTVHVDMVMWTTIWLSSVSDEFKWHSA